MNQVLRQSYEKPEVSVFQLIPSESLLAFSQTNLTTDDEYENSLDD